jgi:hypothetical protein
MKSFLPGAFQIPAFKGLRTEDFPSLIELHRRKLPRTEALEFFGKLVRERLKKSQSGHETALLLELFISAVYAWGWSPRLSKRILDQEKNNRHDLCECFAAVSSMTEGDDFAHEDILSTLVKIHGVGPSFGSKLLRMLRPDKFPVFDKRLREALPVLKNDRKGYRIFAEGCEEIANVLEAQGIKNPVREPAESWLVADVESCLFVTIATHIFKRDEA